MAWTGRMGGDKERLGNYRDTESQVYLFPLFFIASKEVSGLTCFLWDTGSTVFIKMGWSQAGMGPLYSRVYECP